MTDLSDTALLNLWATKQDAEALHEVVMRHSRMVYNTCLRVLGNPADAEDAAQECFVKLARGVRPRSESIAGLLHTMATNQALNRIKSESRRRTRERQYAEEAPHMTEATWEDIQQYVDEAMAELPAPAQALLIAHFFEGRTHEAIAADEGVSRSAISHRMAKGIDELRGKLAKRGIPVGAGALAGLLQAAPAEAAPPVLSVALGKLAMAGATAPGVSAGIGAGWLSVKMLAGLAIAACAAIPMGVHYFGGSTVATARSANEQVPHPAPGTTTETAPARTFDLTGQVYDENENPFENAMVKIYQARPRTGLGVVCPTCYLDCAKRAVTASDGTFTIQSVDAELIFQILILAENHEPLLVDSVDPSQGPVLAKLVKRDPARLQPDHVLRGKVLGPDGDPVVGALVEPYALHMGTSTQYGGLDGIDELAATNEAGEFIITSAEPGVVLSVGVEAGGLAKRLFKALPAGEAVHTLALTNGVTVRGRVVLDGEPLAGISMGIVQTDHSSETFLGETEVATDANGRFVFTAIAPDTEFCVYGQIDSLGVEGSVPATVVQTKDDGTTLDVGTLKAEPGLSVSGQVVLSDGAAVPEGTRVIISRDPAWDWTVVLTDAEGRFTAGNLPSEQYTITCSVPDYHLSAKNASLDPLNQNNLMGVIDRDISELTIVMEPGKWEWQQSPPEAASRYKELKAERLRGAE